MVRTPCYDKNGVKKGLWSQEEDNKLRAYIQRYGHWNWNELPKFAGLSRCGKSCRLRWLNYLRPNVKRGNYTQEEDELIIELHKKLGNKWSLIAANLSGRTDNEIKNHWHTSLKTRAKQNTKTTCEEKHQSSETSECLINYKNKDVVVHEAVLVNDSSPIILESSQLSSEPSSSEARPSILRSDDALASCTINLTVENSSVASSITYTALNDDFWTAPFIPDTYQDNIPSTSAEVGLTFPYIPYGDDVVDLFYNTMQEFPEEY